MTNKSKPMTAAEVIRRQEEWAEEKRKKLAENREERVKLVKLAAAMGDENAKAALKELEKV